MVEIVNPPKPGCSCRQCNVRRQELLLAERVTRELDQYHRRRIDDRLSREQRKGATDCAAAPHHSGVSRND